MTSSALPSRVQSGPEERYGSGRAGHRSEVRKAATEGQE